MEGVGSCKGFVAELGVVGKALGDGEEGKNSCTGRIVE